MTMTDQLWTNSLHTPRHRLFAISIQTLSIAFFRIGRIDDVIAAPITLVRMVGIVLDAAAMT